MDKFFYAICKVDHHGFFNIRYKKNTIYYCKKCDDANNDTITVYKNRSKDYFYSADFYERFYTEKEYRKIKLEKICENLTQCVR